jgi:hypothetical protein
MTEVAIQRIVVLPPWRSSLGNLTYASLFLARLCRLVRCNKSAAIWGTPVVKPT